MSQKLSENIDFNTAYDKYVNLVFKTALNYSGDHYVAEEASQYTFMQLYIQFEQIKRGNIKPWLITTAKNYVLNYKEKVKWELTDENIVELCDMREAARSTEENVFIKTKEEKHTLLRKEIFTQLYQKNPRWWQAVVLAYIYEVPQEDIAVKMRIELNALYQMLYRARKWITKNYREEFEKLI